MDDIIPVIDKLAAALGRPLPGMTAQKAMAPEPLPGRKPYYEAESDALKAGVLLLLVPDAGRLAVVLTKRTENVLHHPGQVSLPGGEQHAGESLTATALRETSEELGCDLQALRVLGRLTPLYIPTSNYCVYTTVAFLPDRPRFRPQPDEVAEVIVVPVDFLLDPANLRIENWDYKGRSLRVPFFEFRGHCIWGATAMILGEFLALLR
jgi:8-oxo-dGTP pyrophosphatase MutT (NUDIX family)